jgi:eukaryotic-like serine/threonine-protein kinase
VLGTAAYISPEQVRGEPVTPASDVYSFGVILYRLLAGRLPFEADSALEMAALHRDAEPPPLTAVARDDRGRALAAVAMSALAKQPSRRPADGAALVRVLDDTARPAAATTQVLPAARPGGRPRRRMPLVAGIAALALAVCGVVSAMLLTGGSPSAPAVTATSRPTHPATTTSPLSTAAATTHSSTRTSGPTTTARRTTTTTRPPPTAATTFTSPAPPPPTEVTTEPTTTLATTTAP